MCRSQADGGRRCSGSSHSGGRSRGLSDDDREYLERVADLDRREAAGERITDIMAAERNEVLQRQIEEMTREAEQARAEEARGW